MKTRHLLAGISALGCALLGSLSAQTYVYLLDVPDYNWQYGCFGTACGNLAGFWDRNGLPACYEGSVGGGLAPLNDGGANAAIHTLWATKAGVNGRPADQPGHVEDYWINFDSSATDPYLTAQRVEHAPDCINDFTGVNQRKWVNMNGECNGNLDGYGFVFWETNGLRRVNYGAFDDQGVPVPDIPAGLREWARSRGYAADSFSQLTDFNPKVRVGAGFTFEDLKAEIDAGYPVLLFLQSFNENYRVIGASERVNPVIHGMLAYGYREDPELGLRWVYYRTSWASGSNSRSQWGPGAWQANMPLRGVIGFRPRPKVTNLVRNGGMVTLAWDGPAARLFDGLAQTEAPVHLYRVQWSSDAGLSSWMTLGEATTQRTATVPEPSAGTAFFRVVLGEP